MSKNILYLLFIPIILVACKQHNVNPAYIPSDEAEITTLAFNETVQPDTTFKRIVLEDYAVNPRAEIRLDKEYIKQQKLEFDSVKNELDTAKIYVIITDTLIRLPKDYFKSQLKPIGLSGKKTTGVDTVLNNWAQEIIINEDPGKFYMKNLAFKYGYQYVLKSKLKIHKGKSFYVGTFRMSSIFFNKNKSKAFVYTEMKYRNGHEIFLVKRNGKWLIIKRNLSWIT